MEKIKFQGLMSRLYQNARSSFHWNMITEEERADEIVRTGTIIQEK